MGLFRRHRGPAAAASPAKAIVEFWSWWPSARPRLEQAIASGSVADVVPAMTARVAAIHPGLHWELARGRTADHALVVSGGGERGLRAVAERWMRASPAPDSTWEFHSARQADHTAFKETTLTLGGHELDLSEVVLDPRVDDEREVLDLAVHHPLFPGVPDEARTAAAFLALDWLLGEDEVERWIGAVTVLASPPASSVPATALPALVAQLADGRREPRWAVLHGTTDAGRPVVGTVRVPLKPVEFPLFDLHVQVTVPYAHADERLLPLDPSLAALCDLEDVLVERLGAAAVFVGHESHDGARELHFYADSEDTVPAQIEAMCRSWRDGDVRIAAHLDGAWERIAHLRV